jgi:nicotinate-nucleotide pyrophosphorylase (carboxylating)
VSTGPAFPLDDATRAAVVRAALEEDAAFRDITSVATVPHGADAHAVLVARAPGVVCGVLLAVEAFRQLDPHAAIRVDAPDGTRIERGTQVLRVSGKARALLAAERTALNYLMHLSGVATMTARFVEAVAGTGATILDTRKTTPGWRVLEKYAVRCGGGRNHRADLSAAVLIKDNHLAMSGGDVAAAVSRARELAPPGMTVEVECDTLEQVQAALEAGADLLLLDNMSLDELRAAVALARGRARLEASGGVRQETVRAIAETGVDFISSGALTHSAPALDLALDFD